MYKRPNRQTNAHPERHADLEGRQNVLQKKKKNNEETDKPTTLAHAYTKKRRGRSMSGQTER